jgi:hypothetical protein
MSSKTARITALALAFALTIVSPALRAQGQGQSQGQGQGVSQAQTSDVEVEGVLAVYVEDATDGSTIHHFLDTDEGRVRLKEKPGKTELAGLESGSRVKIRGRKNAANNELELAGGSTSSVTTLALAASNTFGQQRVVVILVNFQDNAATPYTWSDAYNVTFGQASDFYRQNSYNQTWLTGDVFGWFTIPTTTTTCDTTKIATLADQAATNAGVNLGNYTHRVYAFPKNACSWWGLGTVGGGSPSLAWINGSYAVKVVAHELGHNFGDYHSKAQQCDGAGCTVSEYGDDRDIMGGPASGYFHAYQKERLGWLNYGSSPTIQSINGSGTYWIGNYETGSAPSALKILKSSTSTDQTYYYLEARAQTGYDAPYAPGVIVHTGNSRDGDTAIQVDLDPASSSFDSLLDPGQTFTDSAAGFSVTTVSADESGAWVSITYAGVPCTSATPTVTLSPGSTLTSPGVTAGYSMTVKNNDNATCAPVEFGIGMGLPSGWTWSAGQSFITVAPGGTSATTLSVTPPATANGSASVSAQASRAGGGPSGSAAATLMVASNLSVTLKTVGGSQYQVTATVLAGTAPLSGASVRFTITDPKGSVTTVMGTTAANGVVTIKDRLKGKDPHGTYSVNVSVTSGTLSGSAAGTFVY